jgi:signal transduction protein with GAF and PtsI domain
MANLNTHVIEHCKILNKMIDESITKKLKHVKQSPETAQELKRMHKEMEELKENISERYNKQATDISLILLNIKHIKEHNAEDREWKKEFAKEVKDDYAKKWVEKAVWLILGAAVTTVFALI